MVFRAESINRTRPPSQGVVTKNEYPDKPPFKHTDLFIGIISALSLWSFTAENLQAAETKTIILTGPESFSDVNGQINVNAALFDSSEYFINGVTNTDGLYGDFNYSGDVSINVTDATSETEHSLAGLVLSDINASLGKTAVTVEQSVLKNISALRGMSVTTGARSDTASTNTQVILGDGSSLTVNSNTGTSAEGIRIVATPNHPGDDPAQAYARSQLILGNNSTVNVANAAGAMEGFRIWMGATLKTSDNFTLESTSGSDNSDDYALGIATDSVDADEFGDEGPNYLAVVDLANNASIKTAGNMAYGLYLSSHTAFSAQNTFSLQALATDSTAVGIYADAWQAANLDIPSTYTNVTLGNDASIEAGSGNGTAIGVQALSYSNITTGRNGKITVNSPNDVAYGVLLYPADGTPARYQAEEALTITAAGQYAYGVYSYGNSVATLQGATLSAMTPEGLGYSIQATDGGQVIGEAGIYHLTGNLYASSTDASISTPGQIDISFNPGSSFTGFARAEDNNVIRLNMQGTRWDMTDNSGITGLSLDSKSTVVFTNSAPTRLDTQTLSGNGGNFVMKTRIADRTGDFLNIVDSLSGKHGVTVADSGKEPAAGTTLDIIHAGKTESANSDPQFTLKNTGGRVDVGTYQYVLNSRQGGSEQADASGDSTERTWFLAPEKAEPKPEIKPEPKPDPDQEIKPEPQPVVPGKRVTTPSTDAILAMASAPQMIFEGELQNLRFRKGDLRNNKGTESGVWGRYLTNNTHLRGAASSAYHLQQDGMEIGGDTVWLLPASQLVLGGFISYTDNDIKHHRGGKSNTDSYGVGLYTSWFDNDGWYIDGVLKVNRFKNHLNARMTSGQYAQSDYRQTGVGGSIETGYNKQFDEGYFIEPYVMLSYFTATGKEIKLTNGMKGDINAPRSFRGEAGISGGKRILLSNQTEISPYLKVALSREFIKSDDVTINDSNRFSNTYAGNKGKYGAGVSAQISKTTAVFGEVDYSRGVNTETPVQGNVGFRINF